MSEGAHIFSTFLAHTFQRCDDRILSFCGILTYSWKQRSIYSPAHIQFNFDSFGLKKKEFLKEV